MHGTVTSPRFVCCLIVLSFVSSSMCFAQRRVADLVLVGGKISTLSDTLREVEAVAIAGDRIVAAGETVSIAEWISPATRIIELSGRRVVPGFVESHGHLVGFGQAIMQVDLSTARSWDEVVAQVANATKDKPAGAWIVGHGWHQGKWTAPPGDAVEGYPVCSALDRATPNHKVLLRHGTGHMIFANSVAMQVAGISRDTKAPPGGEILRFPDGAPTGAFRETASDLVERALAKWERARPKRERDAELRKAIDLACQACLHHGVTTFQDAGSSLNTVSVFRDLADAGALPIRLWVMINESNDVLARRFDDVRIVGYGQQHLTVRAIKRMHDGAIGTHGALLLAPYDDLPTKRGLEVQSLELIGETARLAREHGFQLCVHAIGDQANRDILDLMENVAGNVDTLRALRWRIEHAQHLDAADIPRFAQLGVIASMQANHATSDGPFVVQRLGMRRASQGAYAWRSLLDAGTIIANGTDVPVEDIDPIACFFSAVTRQMSSGTSFFPEQAMTRLEALRSYTRDAAYAAFEEDQKGTIEPGKLADLVILSHDILTVPTAAIPEARIDAAIVGGKVLYERMPADGG